MELESTVNLEERKRKEIEHSDRRRQIVTGYEYQTDVARDTVQKDYVKNSEEYETHFSNMKFYSITRSSFAFRDNLLCPIKGKTALDYCCGNGEIALDMAMNGAEKVFGIDISSVAVNNANKIAEQKGVSGHCTFTVMDAEKTEFADNTFDIIHEYGALHHLCLESALCELSRILKPDGKVVCTEALRHNPIIHYYRGKTPHLRTQWEYEHILGYPEIMLGRKYFTHINVHFFHLASLAAVSFRKTSVFPAMLTMLEKVDDLILRIPYVKLMAWVAVFEYKGPLNK